MGYLWSLVSVIPCFGIYGKLLRIVHFALYKNLEEKNGEDNGKVQTIIAGILFFSLATTAFILTLIEM